MKTRKSRSLPQLFCALLILGTAAAWGQEVGRCAVTEVPGHLVLPDGTVHDQGEIKICFDGWQTPLVGRHVIYVDSMPWGYLLSRSGENQGEVARVPLLVFTPRTVYNHVRLLGYAWPEQGKMIAHVLHAPGRTVSRTLSDPSVLLETADRENYVLIAARIE